MYYISNKETTFAASKGDSKGSQDFTIVVESHTLRAFDVRRRISTKWKIIR